MTSHTAPAAVSDQTVAERSFMHLNPSQTVHKAMAATNQPQGNCRLRREEAGKMGVLAEGVLPERALHEPWLPPPSDSVPTSHYRVPRSSARGRLGERRLVLDAQCGAACSIGLVLCEYGGPNARTHFAALSPHILVSLRNFPGVARGISFTSSKPTSFLVERKLAFFRGRKLFF